MKFEKKLGMLTWKRHLKLSKLCLHKLWAKIFKKEAIFIELDLSALHHDFALIEI